MIQGKLKVLIKSILRNVILWAIKEDIIILENKLTNNITNVLSDKQDIATCYGPDTSKPDLNTTMKK